MTNALAICNDTHFGVRGDNEIFLDNQIDFFKNFFIPECLKRGITKVIHAGDVFDKRKNINIRTLTRVRREIFDAFHKAGLKVIIIIGNHDVYYKNTNEFNSVRALLKDYDNIEIIDQYPEVRGEFGGDVKVLYVPWICEANHDDCMGLLERSDAKVVIGHFELAGFDMQPGNPCQHGMGTEVFYRYQKVLSGHFHTRSTKGNITYLGTQYEMTWADCQDPKGFNILHPDLTLEFVQYHNPMFIKLLFDDKGATGLDGYNLKDKFVKLIVRQPPEDRATLEGYIASIRLQEPMDLKIIENERSYKVETDLEVEVEDTTALMNKYVDTLELSVDSEKVKVILQNLHAEALEME